MSNCIHPPGATPELVEYSVERSIQALGSNSLKIRNLFKEADGLLQSIAPIRKRVERLAVIREEVAAIVAPVSSCKEGCSHCCKMAVGITGTDAAAIAKHLGIKARPVPAIDLAALEDPRDAAVTKYMGTVCPFLKNNRCSIYEVRPMACRTHYNLSAFPEVCNVIDYPGNDVPNLDWRPVWHAEAFLELETHGPNTRLGDIREFFPYGADEPESL